MIDAEKILKDCISKSQERRVLATLNIKRLAEEQKNLNDDKEDE
jgi:hypothetical protein